MKKLTLILVVALLALTLLLPMMPALSGNGVQLNTDNAVAVLQMPQTSTVTIVNAASAPNTPVQNNFVAFFSLSLTVSLFGILLILRRKRLLSFFHDRFGIFALIFGTGSNHNKVLKFPCLRV